MRDAADVNSETIVTARLKREMDERECKARNALSRTEPGLRLAPGDVVTVVETFGSNEAFLVEFNRPTRREPDACDWMGVLYPAEIEMLGSAHPRG
ncbi:MAG: hypothetical protein NW223_07820 [Hyphomicrobiaceae bacterium]|nr:hypothetical protein [Hyphomicrobiaceae bacterium]